MKHWIAVALFAALAGAQQKPPAVEESSRPISVDVERVNLLFAVTDKKGRFITDYTFRLDIPPSA